MAIETIANIIRGHGAERPDSIAIVYGDRRLTYQELDERSNRLANALASAGVDAQDRIAFLDKNTPEYFELTFAAAKLNAVNCAVNWRLAPSEAAFIINDSGATVLIIGEQFLPTLDAMASELTTVKRVVTIGDSGHREGCESYEPWIAGGDGTDPNAPSLPDDVALQFYSSGTTGRPKGVMLTNDNCFSNVRANNHSLAFGRQSVNHVAMPTFHVAGGLWGLLGLYNGVPNILVRDIDPSCIIQDIVEHRITHTVLVPAVIQFILMLPESKEADFSSLELIVYGGSPISREVLTSAIATFKCKFIQAYGLTETAGGCVLLPPEDHMPDGPQARRLQAAGKPSVNAEVKVVDSVSLMELPGNTVGEILIRSPQNMKGYWRMPEATAQTILADGFLRTGDAGYIDDDGYLYIQDRIKDMIISGGENVYPAEVENILMSHPAVADVAVIGVPNDKWGETPKAIVVMEPGTAVTPSQIISYAKTHLAGFKCPTSVEFIDVLPRNPSGKVLKTDLRAPHWEGRTRRVN